MFSVCNAMYELAVQHSFLENSRSRSIKELTNITYPNGLAMLTLMKIKPVAFNS